MPLRSREPRKPVRLGVRLKDDSGWNDAQILNVSSRGIMATCARPPRRGTFVEVRRGHYLMVGRVVWTASDRFGAQIRERIVLEDLLMPPAASRRAPRPGAACQVRAVRRPSADERHAASARFSRSFDFVSIALLAAGLAALASTVVAETLADPLRQVELAMRERSDRG